jgi:hypothetical protein
MVTSRYLTHEDYGKLAESLLLDEYHKGTSPEFFYQVGTTCSVYSDEKGEVLFARGLPLVFNNTKIIKLDIQFIDNKDYKRNLKVMLEGFSVLEKNAKANGFTGFIFDSTVELLRKFCCKRLGFVALPGDLLVKVLQEDQALDKDSEGSL